MRILPVATQNVQLTAARQVLRESGFLFSSDSQARVISGEEEGIFGWLTVNYQLSKLVPTAAGALAGSFGALDLGGASTQITFKPTDPNLLSDSFSMRLGNVMREDLYTHSFLYFGQNEAATRMNQAVMFSQWPAFPAGSPPGQIDNPCYFVGYSFQFQDPRTGAVTNMTGTGDFDACRTGPLASLINKRAVCLTVPRPTHDRAASPVRRRLSGPLPSPAPAVNPVNTSTCSVQGEYQPSPSGVTFVAFSAFAYVWNALQEPTAGGSLASFAAKARPLCALSWATAQQQYASVPAEFLAAYCFTASFTTALLEDGYGLDPTDTTALQVASSPDDYGWALGSIIYEANALGYRVELPFAIPFFVMVGVSAVSVSAACAFALLWCGLCPRACTRRCSAGAADDSVASPVTASVSLTGPTSVTKSPLAHESLA